MGDTTPDLVQRLRANLEAWLPTSTPSNEAHNLMRDAADIIEALTAERERLNDELAICRDANTTITVPRP